MSNTRLVTIKTIDCDHMMLTLYYGRKSADKAMMSGVSASSHDDLLETIEQFRLYGLEEPAA